MNEIIFEVLTRLAAGALVLLVIAGIYKLAEKRVKKSFANKKETLICPKCGSINYTEYNDKSKNSMTESIIRNTDMKQCLECEFKGLFPTIDIKDIEGFKDEINKNNKKQIDEDDEL